MNPNDPVIDLLQAAGLARAKSLARRLHTYNIGTLAQLRGALSPQLPELTPRQIAQRGLAQSYRATRDRVVNQSKATQVKRLSATLKIGRADAERVLSALNSVNFPARAPLGPRTALSLGSMKSSARPGFGSWKKLAAPKSFPDRYLLPHYDRTGPVFDQGRRGTCVANATCAMIDYATGKKTSRQFVYHQCKMIDDIPNTEGTFLSTAARILSDAELVDYGAVLEKAWPYEPEVGATLHQGPPPERCFHTDREFTTMPVFVRQAQKVQDIKTLLSAPGGYAPVPVVVGLDLYASFTNDHASETGWITMPLEGEGWIGGHAMLVVGWIEKETPYGPQRLFIVRNSWGTGWAWNNPEKMPGHALIPYAYFEKYFHDAFAVLDLQSRHFDVPEAQRLCNNMRQSATSKARRAYGSKQRRGRKPSRPKSAGPIRTAGALLKTLFVGNSWDR